MSKLVSSIAALALLSGPALSLTAEELWDDWQTLTTNMGGELSAASQDYADGTLTLEGVTLSFDIAGAAGDTDYGTIAFVEQSDGAVAVELPAEMTVTTTSTVDGQTVTQTGRVEHEGMSIVARGAAEARTYDIAADRFAYVFDDMTGGAGDTPIGVTLTFDDLTSTYRAGEGGDPDGFAQALDAARMSLAVVEPGETGGALDYALTSLTGTIAGSYPSQPPAEGATGLAAMGVTYDGTISHSGSTLKVAGTGETGPFQIEGSSDAGTLGLGLQETGIRYDIGSTGAELSIQAAAFPLPIALSMAEARTALTFPMGPVGTRSPYALQTEYRDLAIDDALWALFDPTGQLPRDPATLVIRMEGEAEVVADIFGDPQAAAELAGPPMIPRSLRLTELLLDVVGARLEGSGDLTFPAEAGPVPQPVGTLNLRLEGAFQLLDKLVALGFIPAEQAAFARGMAGAVARPVGEDALESEIVFTEGGGITANGLPLQ